MNTFKGIITAALAGVIIGGCSPQDAETAEAAATGEQAATTTPSDVTFTPGKTIDFEFESNGLTLSGIIDVPRVEIKGMIIIVHSYGETNVREWYSHRDMRKRFLDMGFATVQWDKPGLGRSEGTFDINQSVYESGQEVVDAAAYLRKVGAPGADKIGLWGGSRAGWIAPIALQKDKDLEFWISISGTSQEDNFTYLLLSNLPYEGATQAQVAQYEEEWRAGCNIFRTGGSFDDYLQATEALRANEYILSMRGPWPTRAQYEQDQKQCEDTKCQRTHEDTCDYIWILDFDDMLSSLDVDVLALFGEKDLSINWRKVRTLYENTIGQNPNATLRIKAFEDADHSLNKTETGSMREMRKNWELIEQPRIDGYYDVQTEWLQEFVLDEK